MGTYVVRTGTPQRELRHGDRPEQAGSTERNDPQDDWAETGSSESERSGACPSTQWRNGRHFPSPVTRLRRPVESDSSGTLPNVTDIGTVVMRQPRPEEASDLPALGRNG